ncbi:MAG: polysaccharide deacetylase family protein [Clostridiaceae bacterium]
MIKVKKLFPKGSKKAFTLSYDDGIIQDKRLVEIFNRYGLRATFNLNSGLQNEEGSFDLNNLIINRINQEEAVEIYKGHEIAAHGLTHLSLTDIPRELIIDEVIEDRRNLEELFGYPIRGMAYPNGVYDKKVIDILECIGIEYSRTVNDHFKFHLPSNPLEWNPTTHHNNADLMNIAKQFLEKEFKEIGLFYLWGHSYEFDMDNNWDVIENFCKYISNKEDIWYATNIEIIDYLKAFDRLKFTVNLNYVYNPSAISVWIDVDGSAVEIKGGEIKKIMYNKRSEK